MKAWDEVSETGRMRTGAWTATSMVRYLSHALRERERERGIERERERERERENSGEKINAKNLLPISSMG